MLERLLGPIVSAILGLPNFVVQRLAGPRIRIQRQTLDPRSQLLLRMIGLAGRPEMNELPPEAARDELRQTAGMLSGGAARLAKVEDRRIPGPHGEIGVRVYVPERREPKLPVMLYFHGGGFVTGDLDTHDSIVRWLASNAGMIAVAVDYRLAPEARFPAAFEDAYAAYRWTREHADELGGDPERIAVVGDSAGGNLAAGVCQQAGRDAFALPKFQMLLYPWVDLSAESESYEHFGKGFFLTTELARWFREHYLGPDHDGRDVRASPLLEEKLDGLPEAAVLVAGFDPLRDEGIAYADRLRAAGVEVTTKVFPGLLHGYASMVGAIPAATTAMGEAADLLRQRV